MLRAVLLVVALLIVSNAVTAAFAFKWTCEYYGKEVMWWRDQWNTARSELAHLKGETWLTADQKPADISIWTSSTGPWLGMKFVPKDKRS